MSDNLPIQPKGYTLTRFNLVMRDEYDPDSKLSELDGGTDKVDLRNVCSGWNYIESINSPSVRMEFAIYDTVDLISTLTGNEVIQITIETDSAPGAALEIEQRIFKIGNVVKSERSVAYMIYTVSPETHNNETNKVFKVFKDNLGSEHVNWIIENKLKTFGKHNIVEPTKGNFNFIAPTWRAFDCISYISDKVVSSITGTAGYVFFENKNGYNFSSIDFLCSDRNTTKTKPLKFTYEQANVGESDFNAYKIEQLMFPDRANHLEKMRSGTYSNAVLGLKVPSLTSGNLDNPGDGGAETTDTKDVKGGGGSIKEPMHMGLDKVFGVAKEAEGILNDTFPYPKINPKLFEDTRPTRTKIRALPGMKDSKGMTDSTGGAGNMDFDTVWASAYTFSRYNLLNAITLDITVPGNVGLYVGMVIQINIPASSKEEERTIEDPIYSGLYLITGLRHKYNPEGITTLLNLSKDSIIS